MTALSAFMPYVMQSLPDCPMLAATLALRNACIEFSQRTGCILHTTAPIALQPDVSDYTLALPVNTQIVRVVQGYAGGHLLTPKTVDELAMLFRHTDWRTAYGVPSYVVSAAPQTVTLVPKLQNLTQNAETVTFTVALAPTRDADSVDDLLFTRYVEDVVAGATARLRQIPDQPFHNLQLAATDLARFNSGVNKARIAADRAYGRTSGRVEFQRTV